MLCLINNRIKEFCLLNYEKYERDFNEVEAVCYSEKHEHISICLYINGSLNGLRVKNFNGFFLRKRRINE